jgi:hypothetical protein
MKKIRYLSIRFKQPIDTWELPAWRSAVIEKVGREHVLFHQHLEHGYLYKYPLIQYKVVQNKPVLLCLDKGIEDVYHFFNKNSWDLIIGDRPYHVEVENLKLNNWVLQVWDHSFKYFIRNWLPLNEENYREYRQIKDVGEKKLFLEKILCGNILSLAKGLEWRVDKKIVCRINEIRKERWMAYKKVKLWGLDAEFESNVSLPLYAGLGKGSSKGFGVVSRLKDKDNSEALTLGNKEKSEIKAD